MFENNYYRYTGSNYQRKISWAYFALIIIHTVFGLQILSSFLSFLVNFFRERPSISLYHVAIYAFATFAVVFLAGFLFKFVEKRKLFLILIFALCIARFIIQTNRKGPVSLFISAIGTVIWIAGIIFFISLVQQRKIKLFFTFFPAVLLGFAINTALGGLFGTWDIIWRGSNQVIFFVLLIIAAQIVLSFIVSNDLKTEAKYNDGSGSVFYSLIFLMPFIFLQLYQFQNIAALNARSGLITRTSLSLIIFSDLLALLFVYLIEVKKIRVILTVIAAVIFIVSFWPETSGALYILQIIFGNIAGWWLMLLLLNKSVSRASHKIPWKNCSALAVSGLLLAVFAFVYYGTYDINLSLKSWMIPAIAALIIAVATIISVSLGTSFKKASAAGSGTSQRTNFYEKLQTIRANYYKYTSVLIMFLLFIFPLVLSISTENKPETRIQKDSVRIMHYNIHQGFNIDGYLDLESIARVIEQNGADIVCLNEVSRGWLINGSVDNYLWLADRLGMKYRIFMPASDLIWGNAILSRYPLNLIKSGFLPRENAPLRRSFIFAEANLSSLGIENINIMSTHLHHIEADSVKRQVQVDALLEEWGGKERTIICGDFNAVTGDREIQMMEDAGLVDTQFALEKQDELTWIHYEPYRRIDYIWATPDIGISDFSVTYSRASDHLPISLSLGDV